MQDDFFDDLDLDDDELEETPDWMGFENDAVEDDESDEFDRLRQKSARAGSAYDEMAEENAFSEERQSSFSTQGLTPSQRMILAVLVLLNVLVIGTAVVLLIL